MIGPLQRIINLLQTSWCFPCFDFIYLKQEEVSSRLYNVHVHVYALRGNVQQNQRGEKINIQLKTEM